MKSRHYYVDPFLTTFETEVIEVIDKEGEYHVVLKDTIFYPEGGGQPSDTGSINGSKVSYVYEQDDIIYHVMEKKPNEISVACVVDADRRLDHMQHHTGQHLLSAVLHNVYGYGTHGFHLGEEYTTIDIDAANLSEELVREIELGTNDQIQKNIPIKAYMVNNEELEKLPVRKAPQVESDIRIVEIADMDFSPCCGTHLATTGQIGILKILKTEKYKQLTRIYFICGKRAVIDYGAKHALVNALSNKFSAAESDLLDRINGETDKLKSLESENKQLREELFSYKAQDILTQADDQIIDAVLDEYSPEDVQNLSRHIVAGGSYLALLSTGNRLFLAHNGNLDVHCGNIVKQNAQSFGARGGGSPTGAQAFFENQENLAKFKDFVKSQV